MIYFIKRIYKQTKLFHKTSLIYTQGMSRFEFYRRYPLLLVSFLWESRNDPPSEEYNLDEDEIESITAVAADLQRESKIRIITEFTDEDVIITLSDGSKISNPLNRHTWLKDATPEQRQDFELYSSSIFWLELDEGLDIEAILRGVKPHGTSPSHTSTD